MNIGDRDTCFQCNAPLYIQNSHSKPKKFFYSIPLSAQLVTIFEKRKDLLQNIDQYSFQNAHNSRKEMIHDFQHGNWMDDNLPFMSHKWNLALGFCTHRESQPTNH